MSPQPITRNTLFYGDNLPILREFVPSESVDLIYLDPPFNSNRSYNVLFKDEHGIESEAQIEAFEDTWHWNQTAEETYNSLIMDAPNHVSDMIGALRSFIGTNQMMAYLVMMAIRLLELHRVLKPTGSIYLHCDPTASHYLKILMDTIFGAENYRNEIIWKRSHGHNTAKRYGANHDIILFYGKSANVTWNPVYQEYDPEYIEKHYSHVDEKGRRYKHENPTGAGISKGVTGQPWRGINPTAKGRHWARTPAELEVLDTKGLIYWPDKEGAWPYIKIYLDERQGIPAQEVWGDIDPINMMAAERLGYPTQKPLALLERIIQASSNPGDIVLDPFCGCGTAVAASQMLGRKWIGIDITHLAIALMRYRLEDMFPGIIFDVKGEPEDLGGAINLAKADRYQFQWWALSLIKAKPLGGYDGGREGKKGSDKGVDGVITFLDDSAGKPKKVIVQVKSGNVNSGDIRDLKGTVEGQKADIGVFITLEEPSSPMIKQAVSYGYYHSDWWGQNYPCMQILTINDLLHKKARVEMPPQHGTFKEAQKVQRQTNIGKPELPMDY